MSAHSRPYDFHEAKNAINTAKAAMLASEKFTREAYAKYAEAERAYRVALASKILELHAEGTAWTSTADIARGDKQVANLRFQRDVSEGIKEAAQAATWRHTADRKDLAALVSWSMRVAPDGQYDFESEARRAAA